MLFKNKDLQGIKEGEITLAFRRWKKASVKKGTVLKTSIGLIEILDIQPVSEAMITKQDLLHAGFENFQQLLKSFFQSNDGIIYKIGVRYYSEDPRTQLRHRSLLTEHEFQLLKLKLERLDRSSKLGPWTNEILIAIKQHPKKKATELAVIVKKDKAWLKLNIRKLKNIGLTISHNPGYELSPLGSAMVEKFTRLSTFS